MIGTSGSENVAVSFVLVTPDSLSTASDIAKIFLTGKTQIMDFLITSDEAYKYVFESRSTLQLREELSARDFDQRQISPANQ